MGDLLCKVVVETPVRLNEEQQEILRGFERSLEEGGHHRHSPKGSGWFKSVRDFFEKLTD